MTLGNIGTGQRHRNAQSACPICGGWDSLPRGHGRRCSGYDSGDWCHCSREEHAGSLEPNAAGLYGHLMVGLCGCGQTHHERAAVYVGNSPRGPRAIETTYDYRDEAGVLLYQVVRFAGKQFAQRRPDGSARGGWDWRLGGVRRVPYRLPELMATNPSRPVYIVEGEKDVDTLERLGHVATCNPGGEGKWHLVEAAAAKALSGRDVIVIADRDAVGQRHAIMVADHIRKVARSLVVLQAPEPHKDVSDLVAAGLALSALVPLEGQKPKAAPEPPPKDGPLWDDEATDPGEVARPSIMIGHRVDLVVDALERHMGRLDDGLYKRLNELVTVLPSERSGAPTIRSLSIPAILPRVTRHVQFLAPAEDETKQPKRVAPTDRLISSFAHSPPWPNIRRLVGITETPMMRSDGTIISVPGYDEATGYLYQPSCEYPPIKERPTQRDAEDALASLVHVFCDFPYVDPVHAMVPIAALATVIAKSAISGRVPVFVFEASQQGSGKTLQGDCVHIIATGRPVSISSFPHDEDEQRKTVFACALEAAPVVFFDNIKGLFGGAAIEGAITTGSISQRALGQKDNVRAEWLSTVMVSGNNMTMTDDMLRRSLICRIEPPETRGPFQHPNLTQWVRQNRARLVVDILTILRSYAYHGYPDAGTGCLDSFLEWSQLIPGALVFAGGANVVLAKGSEASGATDESAAFRIVLRDLPSLCALRNDGRPMTVKAILSALYPPVLGAFADLREAVECLAPPRGNASPDALRLGKALRQRLGQVRDGKKLTCAMDRTQVRAWTVLDVAP